MTPEAAARILEAAYRHQRPWRADEIRALLDTPGMRVSGGDGAVLIARIVVEDAEILALATDPDCQRQGAATALIADFHAEARHAGAEAAFLEVAAANAAARAFYAARGYAETGRRPRYYRRPDGQTDDAILMRRHLSDQ